MAKNVLVFVDGHEEDIVYSLRSPKNNYIYFATRSGIYLARKKSVTGLYDGMPSVCKLENDNGIAVYMPADDVKNVIFEEPLIAHGYCVEFRGEVVLPHDATEEDIAQAVRSDIFKKL